MRCLSAMIDQVPYHKPFLKKPTHYDGSLIKCYRSFLQFITLNEKYNVKQQKKKYSRYNYPRQVRPKLDPGQGFRVLDGLLVW